MILLTLLSIPLLNFVIVAAKNDDEKFLNYVAQICAGLFACALLFAVRDLNNAPNHALNFYNLLALNAASIKLFGLLAFIWFVIATHQKNFAQSHELLPIFIIFSALLIAAKSLIVAYFAMFFLSVATIIICEKFLLIRTKFILIFEIVALFIFIALIKNFTGETSFIKNGHQFNISALKTKLLFLLFFVTIFANTPFLLLFASKNSNLNAPQIFLVAPLFMGFCKILFFIKIITKIFGIALFSISLTNFEAIFIELFFSAIILASLAKLLFERDIRRIFFLLFINQFAICALKYFVIFYSDEKFSYEIFINFILSITLLFMVLQNLILYLKNSHSKDISGLLLIFKVNILLFIFIFLNLSSLFIPSFFENFALLKMAYHNRLFIVILVLLANFFGLFLLTSKFIFAFALAQNVTYHEEDVGLARKIDSSSSLSLTAFALAFIMIGLWILRLVF